jgi:hypothetical protein
LVPHHKPPEASGGFLFCIINGGYQGDKVMAQKKKKPATKPPKQNKYQGMGGPKPANKPKKKKK